MAENCLGIEKEIKFFYQSFVDVMLWTKTYLPSEKCTYSYAS